MQTLFYFTILVLTTFVWGYIFYKRDYHPQPLKVLLQSFGVGLLAMGPVFGYKFLYENYLPRLAEYRIFRSLLDSPILSGATVFLMNLIILSLFLAILAGGIAIFSRVGKRSTIQNFKSAIREEPLGFVMVSLIIGGLMLMQNAAENWFALPVIGGILGSVLFLAVIEEYAKHLMVRIADDKRIRDIDDAITLSVVVGLAFAFVETLVFAYAAGSLATIFFRSLVSMPIHLVASGIFGYWYGLAHFANPMMKIEGDEEYKGSWLHKVLHFKKSTVYKEEKITQGFLLATAFHASANILFEFGIGFLAVPIIATGIYILFQLYKIGQQESRLMAKIRLMRRKKKTA